MERRSPKFDALLRVKATRAVVSFAKSVRVFAVALALIFSAARSAAEEKPFGIQVIDSVTGLGVPAVELETMDNQLYVTDSAGRVAFSEPGQMGVPVWFSMRSHGYEFPLDGFGMTGRRFTPARRFFEGVRALRRPHDALQKSISQLIVNFVKCTDDIARQFLV